ncbi:MAG: TRAP transporter TatT component family protein [Sandaracinaceae bacterium]
MKRSIALAAALALVGCGGSYESAWDEGETTTGTGGGEQAEGGGAARAELISQGDAAWENRGDVEQVRAAIAAWEQALEMDGSDADLWVKVSRGHYFLADGHLSFEDMAAAGEHWQQGIRAAERALSIVSPEFAQRMQAGDRVEDAVSVLGADAVPALYWRASNLGKWARADGFATVLSFKDEIRAVMSHCLENGRDFFFSGPDRYFGAFFAIAPAYAGGDLDRSRQHFEYSISQQPNYFGTRVLMAENLAVKLQDREMFQTQLQYVLDGDPDSLEGAAPENRIEQRKAQALMDRIDEFFE